MHIHIYRLQIISEIDHIGQHVSCFCRTTFCIYRGQFKIFTTELIFCLLYSYYRLWSRQQIHFGLLPSLIYTLCMKLETRRNEWLLKCDFTYTSPVLEPSAYQLTSHICCFNNPFFLTPFCLDLEIFSCHLLPFSPKPIHKL